MNLININSHRGITNLLADYILTYMNKTKDYNTIIEVVNCGKFFVVNGLTNSNEILDLNVIKDSFLGEHKSILTRLGYNNINIIDIISYNIDLNENKDYWFTYYDSDRPIYQNDNIVKYVDLKEEISCVFQNNYIESDNTSSSPQIRPSLNISSEFPYGYSLSMGRLHMYYGEHISYQLFNGLMCSELIFKVSTEKKEDDFNIEIKSKSPYNEKDIISLVLDNFDFNLNKFKKEFVDYNIIEDIHHPETPKPWLVRNKKGLVIF